MHAPLRSYSAAEAGSSYEQTTTQTKMTANRLDD